MTNQLLENLASAVNAQDKQKTWKAYEAILNRIPERRIDGPEPVAVEMASATGGHSDLVDVRIGRPGPEGGQTGEEGHEPFVCPDIPLEIAAVIARPAQLGPMLTKAASRRAENGLDPTNELATAGRFAAVPANESEAAAQRVLTPEIRMRWPEAAEEYEARVEAAIMRGHADCANGRYLKSHDPLLGGTTPEAYIEHVAPEHTIGQVRRYAEQGRWSEAIELAEGGPPGTAVHLRAAWRKADGAEGGNPYNRTTETLQLGVGLALASESGQSVTEEWTLKLQENPAAAGYRTLTTRDAAPLMRPRELFTALWSALEGTLTQQVQVENQQAERILALLSEWMILPDPEGDKDSEPVFWEAPGLAPAIRASFTAASRRYDQARDQAVRLARRQARDGRWLAQHRSMASLRRT